MAAQGKRRYDRKQSGYGGQTKPVFHKKVYIKDLWHCIDLDLIHYRKSGQDDQEGRSAVRMHRVQIQDADDIETVQAVRSHTFLLMRPF